MTPIFQTWLYLEPILSGEQGELGAKFRKVDHGYRQVTLTIENDARLSALLQSPRLQPVLDSTLSQLTVCQSALNSYIDDKRSVFPRFYFMSDDDLLELLGQARAGAEGRGLVMQTHLKKLFPGMTRVALGPNDMSITALCSHYGEKFTLDQPVDIDCPVEIWLKNLEEQMRKSLKSCVLKCLLDTSFQYQDAFSFPTQILCLAQNVRFTEQTERGIVSKELHKLKGSIQKECDQYTEVDQSEDEGERIKKRALILQCSYYLEVLQMLIENNVASTSHWLWQKQLRFYLLSSKEIVARMGLAEITYSYEYLGIDTGQFVRTELTDQCFLILTQAFHLGLVGNPFGPAGTGKTESVKALGGLVGRLVLVFNCDEAMDAISMGRLLTGLARSGAWGCFDEFNRLTAATLSIISHQFSSLLAAMRPKGAGSRGDVATLNGKEVSVSEWCGVVATLNPAGRGYGGRRQLPAALARLLRPAAMCRPPAAPLAHHLLAARALTQPKRLAYALAHVFDMASDLLSSQQHYDWGLRALKTVVGSCGRAVEEARASGGGALSEQEQRTIVLRAARLNTMSKLTFSDAQRFDAILSMAFPDVIQEAETTSDLDAALLNSYKVLNLVYKKEQVQKCKELHEQLQQRMGVVIVGPPGSGKTAIRQLLKNALNHQGKNVSEHVICPKAMSRSLLMGHIDRDTRQWTDGVISSTALDVSNQSSDVWSWIVCDGDVDPEWIESLNSVLDDNRLLTLPSGWRIQFGPNVNFVFETHSLEHASPATISRMGVILLSDEDSCAMETVDKWMGNFDAENEQARLALPLLQKTISRCLLWSKARRNEFVQRLYSVAIVKQVLVQYEHIVRPLKASPTSVSSSDDMVVLAIERGLCSTLKPKSADKFMEEVCDSMITGIDMASSDGGWRDRVYLSPRLVRASHALAAALNACSHVLVIGADACAKNILAEHVIEEAQDKLLISINCTPVLEPTSIIDELKRNNVIRTGTSNPGSNKTVNNSQVVLLVKSLQRANVDAWGTSAVQAFLLQLIQHGGFWERGKGEGDRESSMQWCSVRAVQIVMTVSYQAARLCPRLTNAASVTLLREPDDDELSELAFACLSRNVSKLVPEEQIKKISAKMLALYKEVSGIFYSQPHYRWDTSDLARWCDNIQWYRPNDLDTLMQAVHAEAHNIFRHRLINETDTSKFDSIMQNYINVANMEGMYFAPKLYRDGVYVELVEYKDWYLATQKIINQCITESEQSIFGDSGAEACSEIATLCSAIARSVNGEVAVCVGSSGYGRRAAAHVVSTALPACLFVAREHKDFNQQVKNAISSAGSEGCKTILLLEESLNRDIECCVLGSVEAVIRATSLTHLPVSLRPTATQHGDSSSSILSGVKQNLGIVILLDKHHTQLADFIEKYPFLYRRSNFLWLECWGSETLHRMPRLIIQRLMKENISDESGEDNDSTPVDGFASIYSSLQDEAMSSPCRYVCLVKTYYHINRTKKHLHLKRQEILMAGVAALTKARSEVNTLKLDAARQESALSEKQEKATHALNQISATVHSATNHKEEMQAVKKNIEHENAKLQVRKKEIEEELASVEPVISAARAAVGDIRTEALSEVRSLRAPPEVVRDVLEGVLRLMGIADTSWHSMKSFLSKRGVKEDIRNMDASQITAESLRSVERLLEQRGSSFEDKTSKRASAACAPLATWVRANVAYAGALQRVQPLQQQQRALLKNLEDAEAQLAALSGGLQSVDERVAGLKEQLNRYTKEGMEIEIKLNIAKETIVKTESLVDKLSEEYDTWEKDLENISKDIREINLRSLLAAAFVVYLPGVPEDQSRNFLDKWCVGLGVDGKDFSIINFLSSVEDQLKWNANGLPLDISAVKNAVIINQALQPVRRGFTPLIIDPDGDARAWLQNSLTEFHCDFIAQHSDKLYTALQHAIRFGKVLVVEEVTDVEEYWAPLLRGVPITAQSALHADFKLILYSRDATLPSRLPPHHRATLSVIDFTPKLEGLTDQLMHFALQHEKPEIKVKLNALKVQKASLQKQQHELQENLLKDLSSNKNILQDANLLSSLANTRATSATIVQALHEARTLEAQMERMYSKFEASARKGAALLLGVREIAANKYPLVSVPVETLLAVYIEALDSGKVTGEPEALDSERVVKYLTARIVERVMLSLRKSDKHIVILHLLHRVYEHHIPAELWKVFIAAVYNMDDTIANEIKSKSPWIPEENIPSVTNLKMVSPELYDKLKLEDSQLWKTFMSVGDLNSVARLNLTPFEKVVAVQAVRPESLYVAITSLVANILGSSGGAVRDAGGPGAGARWGGGGGARAPRPVLLLGAHAADQLAAHAGAHAHTLRQVWVTADAEASARELAAALDEARGRGDGGGGEGRGGWLVLQIGAAPFSPQLQTYITTFCIQKQEANAEFDPDFRFWIVAEDREIPPLIANTCVNVVLEAPEGVRNNIMSTLSAWGNWESQDMKVARMLFCLAILHAVIQERRAYTPQGWTQWYPFEWGDISAGRSIITSSLSTQGPVSSVTSAGLCEALYAGRISNQADRQILAALVRENLGEQTFAHAWKPRGVNTTLPFAKQLQVYNSALGAFPPTDSPAQLGLPANARLAWEKQQAEKIITGLRDLNVAVRASISREDSSSLKPVLALWRRAMAGSPLLKGDYNINKRSEGWWGAVVAGEAATAARACAAVHSALALAARTPLAHTLTHQVPEEWQMLWPGPELVMKYIRELSYRATAAVKRLEQYKEGDGIPKDVELRGLFSPRRLVAALRASAAAALRCAPESLELCADWNHKPDGGRRGAGDGGGGCAVRGLQLEGAAWSEGSQSLTEVDSGAAPRAHLPPILLYFAQQSESAAGALALPVYASERREELLFCVRAPLASGGAGAGASALDRTTALLNALALVIAEV